MGLEEPDLPSSPHRLRFPPSELCPVTGKGLLEAKPLPRKNSLLLKIDDLLRAPNSFCKPIPLNAVFSPHLSNQSGGRRFLTGMRRRPSFNAQFCGCHIVQEHRKNISGGGMGFLMQPQRHSPQNNAQGERWRSKTKCFITRCKLFCFLSSLIEGVCICLHMKATQLDAILSFVGGICIPLTGMWLVPHQAGRGRLGGGTSCISEGVRFTLGAKKKKQGRGMGPASFPKADKMKGKVKQSRGERSTLQEISLKSMNQQSQS